MELYTKKGKPLQVRSNKVYDKFGKLVGQIKNDKVFGTDGKYVGTIVDDRLVYRSSSSAYVSSPFSASNISGCMNANRMVAAISGDEPVF